MQTLPPGLVVLLVIVLVPIIPAYLLFKFLPSKAVANGPLQGLRIDLGGGFAGYFLVFLTLIPLRGSFTTGYDKWTVTGRIVDSEGNILQYLDPRYVTYSGRYMKSDQAGNFTLEFLTTSDGQYGFPDLYIRVPGYQRKDIFLGPKDKNQDDLENPHAVDISNKKIWLGTIRLTKDPSYKEVTCTTREPAPVPAAAPAPQTNPYLAVAGH